MTLVYHASTALSVIVFLYYGSSCLFINALAIFSAAGLALLMVLGLITRIRLRDPVLEMLPAGVLMLVNAFLAWHALGRGSV